MIYIYIWDIWKNKNQTQLVSFKKKCIFIEVPKTGSTSIRSVVGHPEKPHLDVIEYRKKLKTNFPFDTKYYNYYNKIYSKLIPECLKNKIGKKVFEDFFIFGFVRNPWSRTLSLYLRNEGVQMKHKMTFEEFVQWIELSSDTCIHPSQKKYQLDWFKDENGMIIADYIGKLETIDSDWEYISRELNINRKLPHKNKSDKKRHYTEYYTDKTKEIIRKKFIRDIEYFGYEFGN